MTPTCSVLIPSRLRPELLQKTIDSFLGNAANPDNVEILVRLHDNDEKSLEWAKTRDKRVRVVIGDTEDGYGSLYKFINSLAAMSNGKWLWVSSDDMHVLTKGWENVLMNSLSSPEKTCVLLTPRIRSFPDWRVPILSRALYEVIGGIAKSPHEDCYIDSLANMAGIRFVTPIELEIKQQEYCVPRDVKKTWGIYRSAEVAHKFNVDKIKLGAVLGKTLGSWSTSNAPEIP